MSAATPQAPGKSPGRPASADEDRYPLPASALVLLHAIASDCSDEGLGLVAQMLDSTSHRVPVQHGQTDVQKYQVGAEVGGPLDAFHAVAGRHNLVPIEPEKLGCRLGGVRIVVYDEHPQGAVGAMVMAAFPEMLRGLDVEFLSKIHLFGDFVCRWGKKGSPSITTSRTGPRYGVLCSVQAAVLERTWDSSQISRTRGRSPT